MSKRPDWSMHVYERYLRENRGSGLGPYYKPWYEVHERPTIYTVFRIPSLKNQRIIHLAGIDELAYFCALEVNPHVTFFYEQVPCLYIHNTKRIIDLYPSKKLKHPERDGVAAAVVTSFMYTDETGDHYRTLGTAPGIGKHQDQSKVQIESLYYRLYHPDADFQVVAPPKFSWTMFHNLLTFLQYAQKLPVPVLLLAEPAAFLCYQWKETHDSMETLCQATEKRFTLPPGTGFQLFSQLVLQQAIPFDMHTRLFTQFPRLDDLGHTTMYDLRVYQDHMKERGDPYVL